MVNRNFSSNIAATPDVDAPSFWERNIPEIHLTEGAIQGDVLELRNSDFLMRPIEDPFENLSACCPLQNA